MEKVKGMIIERRLKRHLGRRVPNDITGVGKKGREEKRREKREIGV